MTCMVFGHKNGINVISAKSPIHNTDSCNKVNSTKFLQLVNLLEIHLREIQAPIDKHGKTAASVQCSLSHPFLSFDFGLDRYVIGDGGVVHVVGCTKLHRLPCMCRVHRVPYQ